MTTRISLPGSQVRVFAYDNVPYGDVEEVHVYEDEVIVFINSPFLSLASQSRVTSQQSKATPPSYDIEALDGRTWHLPVKFEFCGPMPTSVAGASN
jgi:hypothetical protein